MADLARSLIFLGLALFIIGLLLFAVGKIPGVGRLPGDIYIRKENFSFFFPLTTSILISLLLSLILFFLNKK